MTYRFNISFDLKSFCLGSNSCEFFSVFKIIGGIGEIEEISGFFDGSNFDVGSTFVFGSFDWICSKMNSFDATKASKA